MFEKKEKVNVGIQMNEDYCLFSIFDMYTKEARVIDFSGGYGECGLPLMAQYSAEDHKFYYENQVDKENADFLFSQFLIESVENKQIYIGNKTYETVGILVDYILHVIGIYQGFNPNCDINQITVSLPDYYYEVIKENIEVYLGEKEDFPYKKVEIIPHCMGMIIYAKYNHWIEGKGGESKINFISWEVAEHSFSVNKIYGDRRNIAIKKYRFNKEIGLHKVKKEIYQYFITAYNNKLHKNENEEYELSAIKELVDQNYDGIMNAFVKKGKVNIYFNFAVKPFRYVFDTNNLEETMLETEEMMMGILYDMDVEDGDLIIYTSQKCSFKGIYDKIKKQRNIKYDLEYSYIVLGTVLYGMKEEWLKENINVSYGRTIKNNYGVLMHDCKFLTMLYKGQYYNFKSDMEYFIVDHEGDGNFTLDIVREEEGQYKLVKKVDLKKKYIIDNKQRIGISICIENEDEVKVDIRYLMV